MLPKRKAATKAKAGGKKAKVEEDKPETTQDVIAKLKASENKSTSKKKRKVDSFVPMPNSYEVTAPQYKVFLSVVYCLMCPSREFLFIPHLTLLKLMIVGKGLQNFKTLSREGTLSCHTYFDIGPRFFAVSYKGS